MKKKLIKNLKAFGEYSVIVTMSAVIIRFLYLVGLGINDLIMQPECNIYNRYFEDTGAMIIALFAFILALTIVYIIMFLLFNLIKTLIPKSMCIRFKTPVFIEELKLLIEKKIGNCITRLNITYNQFLKGVAIILVVLVSSTLVYLIIKAFGFFTADLCVPI